MALSNCHSVQIGRGERGGNAGWARVSAFRPRKTTESPFRPLSLRTWSFYVEKALVERTAGVIMILRREL